MWGDRNPGTGQHRDSISTILALWQYQYDTGSLTVSVRYWLSDRPGWQSRQDFWVAESQVNEVVGALCSSRRASWSHLRKQTAAKSFLKRRPPNGYRWLPREGYWRQRGLRPQDLSTYKMYVRAKLEMMSQSWHIGLHRHRAVGARWELGGECERSAGQRGNV